MLVREDSHTSYSHFFPSILPKLKGHQLVKSPTHRNPVEKAQQYLPKIPNQQLSRVFLKGCILEICETSNARERGLKELKEWNL